MVPPSTYRLQITANFTLDDAAGLVDYLSELGVGALYLSPVLQSSAGSDHGYDVVDPTRIDAARGGAEGWQHLIAAARERGLPVVVDIVPNHLGVEAPEQNPAWWDVLTLGRGSAYAGWFDIEWTRDARILIPVLGDGADLSSELRIADGELRYFEHRYPLAPGTEPRPGTPLDPAAVHDHQHYRLINYRRADTDQNYRRFFAVTGLAGIRVEDPAVFEATHREILRWVREDGIAGLRVDHPDGLADPGDYCRRLRNEAGDVWLTVEKILEPGETLPTDWPVDGTTGYDALAEVQAVLLDPSAEATFDAIYRETTADERSYVDHVRAGKRLVATTILQAEVSRLARLAPSVPSADEALRELLIAFPVYRSYLPDGRQHLDTAAETVLAGRPDLRAALDELLPRLRDPLDELCRRFQQTSGAVMAKGVEDTAYYRYNRFIALNEVGADPDGFGMGVDAFHQSQLRRQQRSPRGMTTLSTHDTKRGEDVRARQLAIAEYPDEWRRLVAVLQEQAPVPNRAFGYLLAQTFVGVGLIAPDRIHAYAEKAMREAADGTGWIDPDVAFEAAVHAAIDRCYDDPDVRSGLEEFIALVTPAGWSNSLAQKAIQLWQPGVPDVYRGTETWEDSLVDPDNRRPVDFGTLAGMLRSLDGPPPVDATGRAKTWLVSRALRIRRDEPHRFIGYTPIEAEGAESDHLVAFDRGGAVCVATRRPATLARHGGWSDTTVSLPRRYIDALTGAEHAGTVPLGLLLGAYPVALLTD